MSEFDYIRVNRPWLEIAMNELGVSEVYGEQDNPRIVEYHSATDGKAPDDETPWCASFVCWVLQKAGYKSPRSAWARSFASYGIEAIRPQVGTIVVLRRGPVGGHVGFYLGENENSIRLLGGNQGNKVSIAWYSKRDLIKYVEPII